MFIILPSGYTIFLYKISGLFFDCFSNYGISFGRILESRSKNYLSWIRKIIRPMKKPFSVNDKHVSNDLKKGLNKPFIDFMV